MCFASVARAQPAGEAGADVAAVRELVADARYAEAIARGGQLLARTDLSAAARNAALEAIATAHVAQRDEARARETLRRLYARDPGHTLSDADASPVVRAAFEAVRAAPPAPETVGLVHRAPGADDVLVVSVESGVDAVHELRLAYRHPGDSEWVRVVMTRRGPDEGRSRLPRPDDGLVVEWFVDAVAPSGHSLASLGSASEPMRVELAARRRVDIIASPTRSSGSAGSTSVVERWWFWAIVGAVVIGGGVAVGIAAGGGSTDPAPPGSLGQRRLQ